jgi:hypothetical protein
MFDQTYSAFAMKAAQNTTRSIPLFPAGMKYSGLEYEEACFDLA